ncbi:MAG: hypothetical protein V1927_03205 [Candidatus Omnitrophota bacterium]
MDKIAVMNEARARYRLRHDIEIKHQAETLFKRYKDEPLFVAGIMLYWAEGTRLPAIATNRKYQLALTNSNPELVELYCKFLRRYFGNVEPNIRGALFIYSDIDDSGAKSFWSSRLKISLSQFIKTQILPSRRMPGKKKLPYGICCVYLNSKDYCYIMESWINNISNYMRG